MYELLVDSNLQGRYRAAAGAAEKGFRVGKDIIWKDFSSDIAAEFIWKKTNFHKFNFELLSGAAKRQAWTIAWVEHETSLELAKSVLTRFIAENGHIPNDPDLLIRTDWGKALLKALKKEKHNFEAWHLETIFKTNAQTAYIDGKFAEYKEQAADGWIESLTYLSLKTARPGHLALNNTTKRIDDPFWDKYLPPIDYNCRCTVVANYRGSGRKITIGIPIDPETGNTVIPGPGFGARGYAIGDFPAERMRF
jgi:SPP1 gp7 family putative phage head morphogenesis protein